MPGIKIEIAIRGYSGLGLDTKNIRKVFKIVGQLKTVDNWENY